MYKVFFFVLSIFIIQSFQAQTTYRCFDCDNSTKLKLSVEYLDDVPDFVQYKGQTSSMKLIYIKGTRKISGATTTESYNEMFDGKVNGKYTFSHSGNMDYITYKRKDGKVFKFTVNIDDSLNETGDGYRTNPCYE